MKKVTKVHCIQDLINQIREAKRFADGTSNGEEDSADVLAVADDMIARHKKPEVYDAFCTFNVDETGLFFKVLQRQTYICKYEDR